MDVLSQKVTTLKKVTPQKYPKNNDPQSSPNLVTVPRP